jgi:hypothetical protein
LENGAVSEGDVIVISVECSELHLVVTEAARTLVHQTVTSVARRNRVQVEREIGQLAAYLNNIQ